MNTHDELLRAIAIVSSIKDNSPSDDPYLEVWWVDKYHAAIAKVENTMNCNLAEFWAEQSSIRPIIVGDNYGTGRMNYSDKSYCHRDILLQKPNALFK